MLEYKRPDSLSKKRQVAHVQTQLRLYIEDLARADGWKKERLLGVAFDGEHFVYLKYLGRWIQGSAIPVTPESVDEFLTHLVKLTERAALIPENLLRDFAVAARDGESLAGNSIQALFGSLAKRPSERTRALFDQWKEQFSEVHGALDQLKRPDESSLRLLYGFPKRVKVELLPLFFSLETYFALFIKLLAYQVVGFYLHRKVGLPLAGWETYPSHKLRDHLERLDQGGMFREMKILNFIEGDLFGWYLSEWSPPIEEAVRNLVTRLNQYDPETIEFEPEHTRDILKQLYQGLLPRHLRHDLGEYYTPDWLAERVLNQLNYGQRDKTLLDKRLLDPGCGSGTFLVLAIKRALAHGRLYQVPPRNLLRRITSTIQGFDLNPLAVISARTNYLLALAELLPAKGGEELTIPVYLCDAINPPQIIKESAGQLWESEPYYTFNTSVGRFRFGAPLVTRHRLQALTLLLEDFTKRGRSTKQFLDRTREELNLDEAEWDQCSDSLRDVYERLGDLERRGIDGIWANIIKNAFAPLFANEFDVIAGNPPWVNWESLPQHYRDATQPLWVNYGLFSLRGQAARLGGGKKDISMLFTYRSIDRYLKKNGRLGFVITQTLFKTHGAGDGFRRFQIGESGERFRVLQVDDMVDLQPFEAATNRTAVLCARKGQATTYPVPYLKWRKRAKSRIELRDSLADVQKVTDRFSLAAEPISDSTSSPWLVAYPQALKVLRKIAGPSAYRAFAGACGWLNGVFWIDIVKNVGKLVRVRNLHDVGKKVVEPIECTLEPRLVYPLLRGRDVGRWKAAPSAFQIVPQDPEKRTGFDERWMKEHLPNTYRYFDTFRERLKERSGYKKYLAGKPFYSIYNVGPYTLAPHKVVWSEVSNQVDAAVISSFKSTALDDKVIIPDHTVIAVAVGDAAEAHYLCALLNSSFSQLIVKGYIALHPSPHIMKHVGIPAWDKKQETHRALARLSRECHEKTGLGIPVTDLEEQIDVLAAQVWKLTPQDLRAVRHSSQALQ